MHPTPYKLESQECCVGARVMPGVRRRFDSEVNVMEFKDLLSLYFERSNAMQMYWNFYITIVLALMAFFGTVKITSRIKYVIGILILAFIAFVIVNLGALREVDQQRIDAKALIEQGAFKEDTALDQDSVRQLLKDMNPPSIAGVTTLHIVGDLFTIAAILTLVLKKGERT
jgi:hypothetical protein